MKNFKQVFTQRHTFLAVIHVESLGQAVRNVGIAVKEGAHGVFLINHSVSSSQLLMCYRRVRHEFPNLWVGINFLGLNPVTALDTMRPDMNGLWVDNVGVNEKEGLFTDRLSYLAQKRETWERDWKGDFLLFGGVAFKYQPKVTDVALAARLAKPHVDVITTSGDATGMPPTVEKIRLMKEAVGDHPLAIASGITPHNVNFYMPYTDCFLVATGVSDSHTELNRDKVRDLAQALR